MRTFVGFTDQIIPVSYSAELVKLLIARGHPQGNVLEGTGVTPEMLSSPRARLSFEQLSRLLQNGLDLSADPALGLALGQRMTVSGLGIVGYAAMSQSVLAGAIDIAVKYHRLLLTQVELASRVEGDRAVLSLVPAVGLGIYQAVVMEAITASITSVAAFLIGQPLPGLELRFAYPAPDHSERYHDVFGSRVSFDCPATEVRFDASALAAPIAYGCEATARMTEEQCAAALTPALQKEGVVRRVRAELQANSGNFPDVRTLAKTLQTSERSLRRALSEHGTSYQEILDDIRLRLAMDFLNTTALPVEDIARNVGFGSSRSFRRAFRRWTGKSPSELRSTPEIGAL